MYKIKKIKKNKKTFRNKAMIIRRIVTLEDTLPRKSKLVEYHKNETFLQHQRISQRGMILEEYSFGNTVSVRSTKDRIGNYS